MVDLGFMYYFIIVIWFILLESHCKEDVWRFVILKFVGDYEFLMYGFLDIVVFYKVFVNL